MAELVSLLPLLNTAATGVLAYLLLTRVEARLTAVERAANRLLRVYALGLLTDRRIEEPVRREARELLREMHRETGTQYDENESRGESD